MYIRGMGSVAKAAKEYQRCTNCVMDTTDSTITFDGKGVCDFCNDYNQNILPEWQCQQENPNALDELAAQIRKEGKGKRYDCVIGMSGGVDSSYLCYVAKETMHLRPLIYVVDTGWNLKMTDKNIDRIVKALDLDMYIEVVDWEEMRDLQIAFLKSQVPYQDCPQDHAIFAGLYNFAAKNGIKYVLTGANNATECIRPPMEWVYINDLRFMRDVHRRFGEIPLKTFPTCGIIRYRVLYPILHGMRRVAPLNFVPYDKDHVKLFLQERFGWEAYENKHFENVFTRFYEGYYLPHKFGFDKRKCYLSNMVLAGTMTREDAIAELERPAYAQKQAEEDKVFIAEKLGLSIREFEQIIDGENKTFRDYRNSWHMISLGVAVFRKLRLEKKMFR